MTKLQRHYLPGLTAAERFVTNNKDVNSHGWKASWNGWTIETFVPHPGGFYDSRGNFDRDLGVWGYTYRFSPGHSGKWVVKVPVSE